MKKNDSIQGGGKISLRRRISAGLPLSRTEAIRRAGETEASMTRKHGADDSGYIELWAAPAVHHESGQVVPAQGPHRVPHLRAGLRRHETVEPHPASRCGRRGLEDGTDILRRRAVAVRLTRIRLPPQGSNRQLPVGSAGRAPWRSTQAMIRSRISVLERASTLASLSMV